VRPFDPADALRLAFVDEAGFVAGGSRIYYCVSGVADDHEIRSLWLADRTGGVRAEITGAFDRPRHPAPSPDGRLALVGDAAGSPQIWLVPTDGGAATALTAMPHGVTGAPAWSPSGRLIAFTARSEPRRDTSLPYRVRRRTFRFDGIGLVEDALQDVYVVDVETRVVSRLTADRCVHEDPRWSPDGRRLLFRTSFPPDEEDWTAKPSLHVLDVESGERTELVGAWGGVLEADWCRGGDRVVFFGHPAVPGYADAYFHRRDLWTVEATGGTPVCRTGHLTAGVGVKLDFDHPTWGTFRRANLRVAAAADDGGGADGDVAYVSAQRGGDVGICRVALSGAPAASFLVADPHRTCFLSAVDAATGDLLYVASSLREPPELFLRHGREERRLTELNDDVLRDIAGARAHSFKATAPDGLGLDAWALTPPGDGPFPTVLAIHGGPSNAVGNVYTIDHQLLVGAGFAVVFGNFRGSFGYGTEFMRSLHGRWGQVGEQDYHAIVDRAIELGIADPNRLGVYGLSHGGFATCWLLGRSDRFRAGVAENPVTDFATLYGTMDSPWWIGLSLGGRPHERPDAYAESSPLTYARNCRAPLLFVIGEADLRCPPTEAEQYFRVLKDSGCPTEMLRLPGCDHIGSWTGPVPARAAQNEALVEWFSRHLGATS
jgi:dipeptidyl aminopeptidase/acylaminoacyl peptidase